MTYFIDICLLKNILGIKKVSPQRMRTTPVKMHIPALVATQFITFRNSKFLCNAKRIHFYQSVTIPNF